MTKENAVAVAVVVDKQTPAELLTPHFAELAAEGYEYSFCG